MAIGFTLCIRKIALKYKILDRPEIDPKRKIQKKAVPLLGGVALFLAFNIGVVFFINHLIGGYLLPKYLLGIFIGGGIIIIGGILDDIYNLKPKLQIIFPILACLVIIASGVGINYITNPFGGTLYLDQTNIELINWDGLPYKITLLADLFTLIWLLGMTYTTKFLDGLDGLVPGITVIGSFIIFCLSISSEVTQPETALLAILLAGAALGFLLFNFNPAKIFLGEGGSLFTGFMLGVLAIISGGKIATALLIMGLPILDVLWVIFRRVFIDKKSPFKGDRKHLHFRLLDIGLTHRQSVIMLWLLVAVFGSVSLFLKSQGKLWAMLTLGVIMVILGGIVVYKYNIKRQKFK